MMEIEEIRRSLSDRRLDIVAEATGLSANTIGRIRDGKATNPTLKTLLVLSDYLEGKQRDE